MRKTFFGDVLKLGTRGNDSFLEGDQKEKLGKKRKDRAKGSTHLRVMIRASPKCQFRSHKP